MPPKNKGKKGKKNDDDYWSACYRISQAYTQILSREAAGESVAGNKIDLANGAGHSDDDPQPASKGSLSAFAALAAEGGEGKVEDEEEDFGGLMVSIYCLFAIEDRQVKMVYFSRPSRLAPRARKIKRRLKRMW